MDVDDRVEKTLAGMTLDEKVGQCLTHTFRGSTVTPSIVETIEKLHAGGLRVEPYALESADRLYYGRDLVEEDFEPPEGYFSVAETHFTPNLPGYAISAAEYARRLNRLKEIAMSRPGGVPLHICTDFEGDFSHDFQFDGINMFPAAMGLRAGGEPAFTREVAAALGRQLSAIGINMLHSPVCDVNIDPRNPEIHIRAFSDDAEVVGRYAAAFMEGLHDGGVTATAKHFPGRGDSSIDAHDDMPALKTTRDRMDTVELAPYRELIRKGLRAIMTAHTLYPALDAGELPATLSHKILVDVLRNELGFEGVITTDAMGMAAIVRRWGVPRASAMAIKAGCNLVLLKFDNELRSQVFFEIRRWVQDGRLSEEELDASLRYVLKMKHRQGLFDNGGIVEPEGATSALREPETVATAKQAAFKSLSLLRDRRGLLPLRKDQRLLVVEQLIRAEFAANSAEFHYHVFVEAMLDRSMNLVPADCSFSAGDGEIERILSLARDVDVVVLTNHYWRLMPENNTKLIERLAKSGKAFVVVTNNPYPALGSPAEADTVLCTYSVTPESMRAAARALFGEVRTGADWPLTRIAND